jgi:xanthine/uracil permease
MIGSIQVSPLAIATLVAIMLNVVIPEPKDNQKKVESAS